MHRPSDRDVNWMSPVQGKSPPVQVKEPYGNLDMVTCATRSIQSTPADNTRKRVWQYIEKERKSDRNFNTDWQFGMFKRGKARQWI